MFDRQNLTYFDKDCELTLCYIYYMPYYSMTIKNNRGANYEVYSLNVILSSKIDKYVRPV